jgi:hypothetical protein
MRKATLYLSGGMEKAKNLGSEWRKQCKIRLQDIGYDGIDIAELDILYNNHHGNIFDTNQAALKRKSNIRRHFVQADLKLIERWSDAAIVLFDESVQKGAGTISECQHCYNNNIPVFIVNQMPDKFVPGWLFALSTKIFDDFEQLYEYLDKLEPNILKKDQYGNHRSGNSYLCSLCGDVFTKHKSHFVSMVYPTYCHDCVKLVAETVENQYDRLQFFEDILGKGK